MVVNLAAMRTSWSQYPLRYSCMTSYGRVDQTKDEGRAMGPKCTEDVANHDPPTDRWLCHCVQHDRSQTLEYGLSSGVLLR